MGQPPNPSLQRSDAISPNGEHRYVSATQAASLLGVDRTTVWRWVKAGRLPATRANQRAIRIADTDLDRLRSLLASAPAGARRTPHAGSPHLLHRQQGAPGEREHRVQFYETDAGLVKEVGQFTTEALGNGGAAVLVATPEHQTGIVAHLLADGIDIGSLEDDDRFVCVDANDTLERCMVAGEPNEAQFRSTIEPLLAQAGRNGRQVVVFGEMVALLANSGRRQQALQLEGLWNGLQKTRAFSLLCAYPVQPGGDRHFDFVSAVNASHSHVIPAESYSALATDEERRRAIALLQHKALALEAEVIERRRAERLRNEFLTIAAHELKTPLTTLSGHTQLLLRQVLRGQPPPLDQLQRGLRIVAGQTERLTSLIDQLLDISRLQSGKLQLELRPVDLATLTAQIVADAQPRAEQHRIILNAPPLRQVQVDPLRIEQVLANLLDNAIRYSPNGGEITVHLDERGDGTIELSVRDHGLGIPPEVRERIFDQFYQAHTAGHRSGLGLGLFISRQIVELHGGTIRAEFPEDGGTHMTISLPADHAE